MMSTFSSIFKMNVKQQFQYRTAAISGMVTQFFFGFMQIALFTAFLSQGESEFTVPQMASYIWLQQCFFTLFKYWDTCKPEISEKIVNGDMAYQLIRPMNLYDFWFQTVLSKSFGSFLMRAIPLSLVVVWLPAGLGLMAPVSLLNFLLFLVSAVIGAFLVTAIVMIAYIISLYTLSPAGVFSFLVAVAGLLAGQIVPLPMLPESVQTIFSFFPFRYVSDLPYRIFIGNINGTDALVQIGIQLAWLVGLVLIGKLVMNKKLKKLVVQGG
ncbi:MAG: ABC transporter permease [Clostridia bacterium]|nr:ABC transporter permease [Clostridia bacterium]